MNTANKKIQRWCLAGFIAILVLGSVFHYVFAWTNAWRPIGLFVPVNESVWEHLKLGYWALLVFSAVEGPQLKKQVSYYGFAKALGVLLLSLTILGIHYSYTAFTGKSILWVDIGSFVAGAFFCQVVAYKLYRLKPGKQYLNWLGLIFLLGAGLAFAVFTVYPPKFELFKDARTNTYGISRKS